MKHKFPEIEYGYYALEPYIDAKTMEIHHSKHHKAYFDKFNTALEGYENLQQKNPEELLKNLDSIPEKIRTAVIDNCGGHVNHSFFWQILKKDVKPKGEILEALNKKFGSFEKFKEEFSKKAVTQFGSGWAWLVLNNGELEVISTSNQESPLSQGKIPLLTLDVWEHAYYLKYQNRRAEYVENFFNVINWKNVNELYIDVKK